MDSNVKDLKSSRGSSSVQFEISFDSEVKSDHFESINGVNKVEQIEPAVLRIKCDSTDIRKELLKVISENDLPLSTINQYGDSLENIFKELTVEEEQEQQS